MSNNVDGSGHPPAKMISIWFFVSLVLGVYGLIVTALGVQTAMSGEMPKVVLGETNPCLWWGLVMVSASVVLFILDRVAGRR